MHVVAVVVVAHWPPPRVRRSKDDEGEWLTRARRRTLPRRRDDAHEAYARKRYLVSFIVPTRRTVLAQRPTEREKHTYTRGFCHTSRLPMRYTVRHRFTIAVTVATTATVTVTVTLAAAAARFNVRNVRRDRYKQNRTSGTRAILESYALHTAVSGRSLVVSSRTP